VFELEEESSRWKRKAEVELLKELTAARHQVSVLNSQKSDLEDRVEELEMRIKQNRDFESSVGGNKLRQSEDRYQKEQKLYDEIDLIKRHKIELESVLLDRDTTLMEMRFEEDQHHLEVERLRRRNRELEYSLKQARAQAETSGASHSHGDSLASPGSKTRPATASAAATGGKKLGRAGGGARGEDSADHHTLETMSRMIEELRKENSRLKASKDAGFADKRVLGLEKSLATEKKRSETLQTEVSRLQAKLKDYADTEQTLIQRQQRITGLQKQLKKSQEEYIFMKTQYEKEKDDANLLQDETERLQAQIAKLEGGGELRPKAAVDAGPSPAAQAATSRLQHQLKEKDLELDDLHGQIYRLNADLKAAHQKAKYADSGGDGGRDKGGTPAHVTKELNELRAENARMHEELDVLDADFFDEIENLKYNYSESTKKVNEYERKYGPLVSMYGKTGSSRR